MDAFLLLICFRVFDSKAFFGILSWIKGTVCAKHRNGERNSLSQSLTALPAPSGREPLAVHAKFPVLPRALPLGELARQRLRGRARYKQFHLRKKRLPEQTFLCGASFLKFPALLAGEEPQGSGGAEHLARPQHSGGELRMRGAAGIVLGLQCKAAVLLHGHAALAGGGAVL